MPRFELPRKILEPLPYWRMEPSNELAFGGPCLALDEEAYAFYVEDSRNRSPAAVLSGIVRPTKPESFGKASAVLVVRRK